MCYIVSEWSVCKTYSLFVRDGNPRLKQVLRQLVEQKVTLDGVAAVHVRLDVQAFLRRQFHNSFTYKTCDSNLLDLGSIWTIMAPNGTNLVIFKISYRCILKTNLQSARFFQFGAYLVQFEAKSGNLMIWWHKSWDH